MCPHLQQVPAFGPYDAPRRVACTTVLFISNPYSYPLIFLLDRLVGYSGNFFPVSRLFIRLEVSDFKVELDLALYRP